MLKKIFTFALAVLLGTVLFAQNYLYEEENFTSSTFPQGWSRTAFTYDGNSYYSWWMADDGGFTYSTSVMYTGEASMLVSPNYNLSLKDTMGFISFEVYTVQYALQSSETPSNRFSVWVMRDNDENQFYQIGRAEWIGEEGTYYNFDISEIRDILRLEEQSHQYQFYFTHHEAKGDSSVLAFDNFSIGTKMATIYFRNESNEPVVGSKPNMSVPTYRWQEVPGCTEMTREGYEFLGWSETVEGFTQCVEPGDFFMLDEDAYWFARWKQKKQFTFDVNGAEGQQEPMDVYTWLTTDNYWSYAPAYFLPNPQVSMANRHFAGWNTAADGTGKNYMPGDTAWCLDNRTFYAMWEEGESYVISFDANGGDGIMPAVIVNAGSQYTAPACTFINGYIENYEWNTCQFIGWNTAADGTGTAYAVGNSFTPTADITLYAQWDCSQPDPEPQPDQPNGIDNVELQGVSVYPNPVQNVINVKGVSNARLEVLDLTGRVLLSDENAHSLNVMRLESGIYMLRISTAEGTAVRKIVKK